MDIDIRLNTLPEELVLYILGFLNAESLAKDVSVVSHQFNLYAHDGELWHQYAVRDFDVMPGVVFGPFVDWMHEYQCLTAENKRLRAPIFQPDATGKWKSETDEHGQVLITSTSPTVAAAVFAETDIVVVQTEAKVRRFPSGLFHVGYFELTFVELGQIVGIGVAPSPYQHSMPGWGPGSVGYHSDDGTLREGRNFGALAIHDIWKPHDVVGCGIDFWSNTVFFTHNGELISHSKYTVNSDILYPTFSAYNLKSFKINMGAQPFLFDVANYAKTCPVDHAQIHPFSTIENYRRNRKVTDSFAEEIRARTLIALIPRICTRFVIYMARVHIKSDVDFLRDPIINHAVRDINERVAMLVDHERFPNDNVFTLNRLNHCLQEFDRRALEPGCSFDDMTAARNSLLQDFSAVWMQSFGGFFLDLLDEYPEELTLRYDLPVAEINKRILAHWLGILVSGDSNNSNPFFRLCVKKVRRLAEQLLPPAKQFGEETNSQTLIIQVLKWIAKLELRKKVVRNRPGIRNIIAEILIEPAVTTLTLDEPLEPCISFQEILTILQDKALADNNEQILNSMIQYAMLSGRPFRPILSGMDLNIICERIISDMIRQTNVPQ